MLKYKILYILILCNLFIFGQESSYYSSPYPYQFSLSEDFFESGHYGLNIISIDKFLTKSTKPEFDFSTRVIQSDVLDQAISQMRLDPERGAIRLKNLLDQNYNLPHLQPGILEYASHCYNIGDYNSAIEYYDRIEDAFSLSDIELSELSFKKGYSYFINKNFSEAIKTFAVAKELRNTYFYHNNYYYGMCQYFNNKYSDAVESFKRAAGAEVYSSQIPYYLTQIYFAQKEFDKLITYAEQKVNEKNIDNVKEIRLLLGQTYYIKGDYIRSLNHLEYYEANTEKLTAEEFYQLAFTQYKQDRCDKAKLNFLELTNLNSKMGQQSNYYLADCLLKEGDKTSARAAFKKVAQMDFDIDMKEEAYFNYGKMSAESGVEREAINVLVDIKEKSRYYNESQDIINDILVNSGDYTNSIKIIESLPKLTERIKQTYQSLAIKHALILYSEGKYTDAEVYLDKSLSNPTDKYYTTQAYYWKAKIRHNEAKYDQSNATLEKYFEVSNGINDLPDESDVYMAHYINGYNNLKLKEYKKAEISFKNAVVGINIEREQLKNDIILNRILPDALIRTGDCLFKQKNYNSAKTFYEQAINRKQGSYVYAIFQKAIIEGLVGQFEEKITSLQSIIVSHPSSEYADDSYFLIGDTHLSNGQIDKATAQYVDLVAKYGNKSSYYYPALLKLGLINYNKSDVGNALYYYKSVAQSNASVEEKTAAVKAIEEIYVDKLVNTQGYLSYLDSIGFKTSGLGRDSLSYHLALGVFNNAEYQKASEAFGNYLESHPLGYYKNDALYYRAESNNVLKDYGRSLQDYEAILRDGPSKYYYKSLYKAALISFNYTQDFDKSLRYYKEYEGYSTDPAELFQSQYGALKSAFKTSKENDIATYGQKVIDNNASTKEEKATAHYYMAKTFLRKGELDMAYASFAQVEKLGVNNQAAEARYLLAEILYLQKAYDNSEKQCGIANEKNTSYPYWIAKGLLLLSDIYVVKNDLLNARAAIEAVLDNFKDDVNLIAQAEAKLQVIKGKEASNNRVKTNTGQLEVIKGKTKNE